jgi:hypothetical protein
MNSKVHSDSMSPPKQNILVSLRDNNASLTEDMQKAAIARAKELGYNLAAGSISIEEILINLTQNRNIVSDAIKRNKLGQLPLRLQHDLFNRTERVRNALQSLVNGVDAISTLDDAVEDLTASIWQNNLNNLSDQVLGYEQKINQLKAQEVHLNRATTAATEFIAATKAREQQLADIDNLIRTASEHVVAITTARDQAIATTATITVKEQDANAVLATLTHYETAAKQHASDANSALVSANSSADQVASITAHVNATRENLDGLNSEARQLLIDTVRDNAVVRDTVTQDASVVRQQLVDVITTQAQASAEQTRVATEHLEQMLRQKEAEFTQAAQNGQAVLETHMDGFHSRGTTMMDALSTRAGAVITSNDEELNRLTKELGVLEASIREAIEKATGYTLFHAFQRRQEDLVKSTWFWRNALAVAVAVSLGASAYLILELPTSTALQPVFFVKLSISLPLIYAIAFCSAQYSRERRLEEEYAFKSAISVSLDPYQRLVEKLVDKGKEGELPKYTGFVIDSINRVFTSPTERIFDETPKNRDSAREIIKAATELIDPLLKKLK